MLDNGDIINESEDVNDLASCLKCFFRELPQSLIYSNKLDYYLNLTQIQNKETKIDQLKELVSSLSQSHKRTLEIILNHFIKMNDFSSITRMDMSNFSLVFGPTFFPNNDDMIDLNAISKSADIVHLLLLNFNVLFVQTVF